MQHPRPASPYRSNPLLRVDTLERRHRRSVTPLSAVAGELALRGTALVVLVPLVRSLFLGVLDQPEVLWPEALSQVALRFAFLIVGWLALDTYTALIRGGDREVLAVLPIDPAQVVLVALMRVARRRWGLLPAVGLLLLPVALAGAPRLWMLLVVYLSGAWAMGLSVSACVHLFAIHMSEDPRFHGVLDLVRGNNPRPQAAFLYAPGAALLVCGLLLAQAAHAFTTPGASAALWLTLPFLAAASILPLLPPLGRATWFRATAVLAEIDARYAALADPEEGQSVYLDWVIRGLPRSIHLYALDDLRHGWRQRRTGITGAWLLGVGGMAAAWTSDPAGPWRAWIVVAAATCLCGTIGIFLASDEPDYLRTWLPRRHASAHLGRAIALALWLQPCVLLPATACLLRHGGTSAAAIVIGGQCVVMATAGLSIACGRLASRGMAVYAPVATVAAAAMGLAGTWLGGTP